MSLTGHHSLEHVGCHGGGNFGKRYVGFPTLVKGKGPRHDRVDPGEHGDHRVEASPLALRVWECRPNRPKRRWQGVG